MVKARTMKSQGVEYLSPYPHKTDRRYRCPGTYKLMVPKKKES